MGVLIKNENKMEENNGVVFSLTGHNNMNDARDVSLP